MRSQPASPQAPALRFDPGNDGRGTSLPLAASVERLGMEIPLQRTRTKDRSSARTGRCTSRFGEFDFGTPRHVMAFRAV
jgi:hypothetical protein